MIAGQYCAYPSMWYTNIQAVGKLKKINTISSRFMKNCYLVKLNIC